MATGYAYLQGGPCDGTRHLLTVAEADSDTVICKSSYYRNISSGHRPNGDIIFDYAGKVENPAPTLKAPQALKGWKDMQRSINHTMPSSLQASARSRNAALRQLARARKVRL